MRKQIGKSLKNEPNRSSIVVHSRLSNCGCLFRVRRFVIKRKSNVFETDAKDDTLL